MKTTSLDIDEIKIKKKAFGYDTAEVEALKKLASNAISDSAREINQLKEMLARVDERAQRATKSAKGCSKRLSPPPMR